MDWNITKYTVPTSPVPINTMISDENGIRNQQKLIYDKGLWWTTDKSMYVYYTPTHWKY